MEKIRYFVFKIHGAFAASVNIIGGIIQEVRSWGAEKRDETTVGFIQPFILRGSKRVAKAGST